MKNPPETLEQSIKLLINSFAESILDMLPPRGVCKNCRRFYIFRVK